MITIVDYGLGNLGSIKNMFKRIGVESEISGEIKNLSCAKKILLPGVGAFDAAVQLLKKRNLWDVLNERVLVRKVPILGMHLLTNGSEEGQEKGFGWINSYAYKFKGETLKVPHMGWNELKIVNKSSLVENLYQSSRFYFVHSFYVKCFDDNCKIAETEYNINFDSIINQENIFGVQFHPEKSHKFGMKLLENFAKI